MRLLLSFPHLFLKIKNLKTMSLILMIFSVFRGSFPPTPLTLRPSSSLGVNICRSSWTAKFLPDRNWNRTSLSANWDVDSVGETGSGTDSIGTGGTVETGTGEVNVGTLGGSGDTERTAINMSRRSCVFCCCSVHRFVWCKQVFLTGCLVIRGTNFIGLF